MFDGALGYRSYRVSSADRLPLLRFMLDGLAESGCRILNHSGASRAPFRISFETPAGERLGILAYAFLANQRVTANRPADEHRFQIKYGSKSKGDANLHHLWQDPDGLYTTLLLGINPELGVFVAADASLRSPTRFFISVEFKQAHVDRVLSNGWAVWERDRHPAAEESIEVLVGGVRSRFLDYVLYEREAAGEDQGHRALLAERFTGGGFGVGQTRGEAVVTPRRLHALAREFRLSETEVLDLIASARRLKMAVRGWVAEEHLVRRLSGVSGVSECTRLETERGPDVSLRFRGGPPITIECKNVLRAATAQGLPRVDFQRTRAAKSDPCSRYYGPAEFDLVAVCLHARTERWEFRFRKASTMTAHANCAGRLASNVVVDDGWTRDVTAALEAAGG